MRSALAILVAVSLSAASTTALAQNAQAPAAAPAKCENPNALGVARIVEIDTTGGPGFGFEHFKAYDFLRDKEVVLTFDDGPWPNHTTSVLKALAEHCTKALFFPIGKHAGYHPEILRRVAAEGHTVGSHTWSHKDLSRMTQDEAVAEFEKGVAAVSVALGNKPVPPFFRFPALRHPPEMLKYLAERNVSMFSTDLDSFDFKTRKAEQVINTVMKKLEKGGKGIVLMHDFQQATANAAPELLKRLKDGGYKVVHITGKTPLEPKKEYVDFVTKEMGGGIEDARPMSSVIKTIKEN